jgi:hypothetical protein
MSVDAGRLSLVPGGGKKIRRCTQGNIFLDMEPTGAVGVLAVCILSAENWLREIWHERDPHNKG